MAYAKYWCNRRNTLFYSYGKDIKKWTKKVKVGDPEYFDYGGKGIPVTL